MTSKIIAVSHAAVMAGLFLMTSDSGRAQNVTYSGEAVAVSANVLGVINTTISDTGALPSSGGSLSNQLASLTVPGLLSVGLMTTATEGENGTASSQASVADVNLAVAGIGITASVLDSNATATCNPDQAAVSGASLIANLKVNHLAVSVTGAPNQAVPLLVGSLVINEQISSTANSPSGPSGYILVNALHLRVNGLADVVIASSQAGAACQQLSQRH